jgi:hypothetical protein
MMKPKNTTLALTESIVERLDAYAQRNMINRSAGARQLLSRALQALEDQTEPKVA